MASYARDQLSQLSFHGIPRAAAAKSVSIRIVWLLLFFSSFSVFTAHFVMLLRHYLHGPISTEVQIDSAMFRFPDLYICNPIPISEAEERGINFTHLRPVMDHLHPLYNSVKHHVHDEHFHPFMMTGMWSTLSSDVLNITKSHRKLFIQVEMDGKPLSPGVFEAVPHNKFRSCFKFQLSSKSVRQEHRLRLFLYMDNSQLRKSNYKNKTRHSLNSMSYLGEHQYHRPSGLHIYMTETGIFPDEQSESLIASTGMRTQIVVSMIARHRLKTSKFRCKRRPTFLRFANPFDESRPQAYVSNRRLCKQHLLLLKQHETCGCLPHGSLIPLEIKKQTARCRNMTHWSINSTKENIICENFMKNGSYVSSTLWDQILECKSVERCNKNIYSLQWSSSLWPAPNLAEGFVRKYMRKVVDPPPEWKDVLDAKERLTEMVRNNVVVIDISNKEVTSDVFVEYASYPLITFLSDIGGILGLYMGMSVLSLCELLECFKILLYFVRRRAEKRRAEEE